MAVVNTAATEPYWLIDLNHNIRKEYELTQKHRRPSEKADRHAEHVRSRHLVTITK